MTDDDVKEITPRPRRHLPEIELPNDTAVPRFNFARNRLGVCERTATRLNLPTIYIGGIAYILQKASLKIIADKAKRRNQPAKRRKA